MQIDCHHGRMKYESEDDRNVVLKGAGRVEMSMLVPISFHFGNHGREQKTDFGIARSAASLTSDSSESSRSDQARSCALRPEPPDRNDDSSPSANTRPSSTVCFPATTAYTGTDVTKSCGASFCRMVPLTTAPVPFGVIFTALSSSFGKEMPLIQPFQEPIQRFLAFVT